MQTSADFQLYLGWSSDREGMGVRSIETPFYEGRWRFLASLFWPLFGAAIVLSVEGTDSVLSRDGGWLAKGAAVLALVVIVIAIQRTVRPALVLAIEPDRLVFLCRRHDLGWLTRYRLRSFDFDEIERLEIGVRTDLPLTSYSEALYSAYVVVGTSTAAETYSYAPLHRIRGYESLVLALTDHPRLAGRVTVGPLRASQSQVSRAMLNMLSQPLRFLRRAIRGREHSSQ